MSDRVAITTGNNLYVNVESSAIRIEFGPEFGGGGPLDVHKIVFNDLDFADANTILAGFTLDTNLDGIDASRIHFYADSLAVNYANLNYPGGQFFPVAAGNGTTPEPSSLLLMIVGPAVAARRRARRQLRCETASHPAAKNKHLTFEQYPAIMD